VKLTAKKVSKLLKRPGRYGDGRGLAGGCQPHQCKLAVALSAPWPRALAWPRSGC
jgi:hypothetical protein